MGRTPLQRVAMKWKFLRFPMGDNLQNANRLSCRSAFRSGLLARGFRLVAARGMLALARCDAANYSRAVARLSIAATRRSWSNIRTPTQNRPKAYLLNERTPKAASK